VTALSHGALLWVAEGAMATGLALDPAELAAWHRGADALGPLTARGTGAAGPLERLLALGARDRRGPDAAHAVAVPTRTRWRADPAYRPRALQRVAPWLGAPRAA
jgi:hypothetical protein